MNPRLVMYRELATLAIIFVIAGSWFWLIKSVGDGVVGSLFSH